MKKWSILIGLVAIAAITDAKNPPELNFVPDKSFPAIVVFAGLVNAYIAFA